MIPLRTCSICSCTIGDRNKSGLCKTCYRKNDNRSRGAQAKRLWPVPEELWPEYRFLTRIKRLPAAEAKAILTA